ncbi:MAG: PAS domain-containing protein [Phycisphaerales bacterium]|nr:PAS domain-containing protein [Phycisphaerales bacterium]
MQRLSMAHNDDVVSHPAPASSRGRAIGRYAIACGLVMLAGAIRWLVDAGAGAAPPFLSFVVAVVLTAGLAGTGPALLATALGGLLATSKLFSIDDVGSSISLAMYLLASLFCILSASLLDRAREEAITALKAAERRRTELEKSLALQRQAEQKLNENQFWLSMAERAAQVGRWSHDLSTGETLGSETLTVLLGAEPASVTNSYRDLHARVHPEDMERVRSAIEHALQSGTEYEVEFRIIRDDGQERWVNERGKLFADPILGTQYLSGVVIDATRRKQAELHARELRSTLSTYQAEEAQRVERELERVRGELVSQTRFATIGQLSASIAHDLRNPLGVIRNAVHLLRRRLTKLGEKLDLLNMMDDEVLAADAIITNMMEMTRGREPARTMVDFGALAREIAARMDSTGRIIWRFQFSDEPFLIWCDASQFRQVVNNLFRNAIEAMKGQGQVTLTAHHDAEVDVIVIRDAGPGIAEAVRAHLFEPLTTSKKTGTGLGLMICRQIIERHGGKIVLDPDAPNTIGASFSIIVPRPPTLAADEDDAKDI